MTVERYVSNTPVNDKSHLAGSVRERIAWIGKSSSNSQSEFAYLCMSLVGESFLHGHQRPEEFFLSARVIYIRKRCFPRW